MKKAFIFQSFICLISFILLWQLAILIFKLPLYILPSPLQVAHVFNTQIIFLLEQTKITVIETLLGLLLGSLLGFSTALVMILSKPLGWWLKPMIIISQALPTFAIAPLFVIWFGYGISSKIAVTMLMLFFPVASNFYDGLKNTNKDWLELTQVMNATRWNLLWRIQIPAALPNLAVGLRIATAIAPIGAIIGEWVGSSSGLGFVMLNADSRMQIDMMFAALIILIIFSLLLYYSVDKILEKLMQS